MIRPVLVAATLALAAPAHAQGVPTYGLPENCTAYLTVQARDCSVAHHFTCEGDAEGTQRRIELGEEGVTYVGQIDAETQWLVSSYAATGHTERLEDDPADRASFSDLMDEGISTYDFQTESEEIGPLRYVGADILTGETEVIDGVELLVTEFTIRMERPGGPVISQIEGREFISPEWRMFLSGTNSVTTPEGSFERDGTPVEFVSPGEPGFLAARPKFGCGATESSWERLQ